MCSIQSSQVQLVQSSSWGLVGSELLLKMLMVIFTSPPTILPIATFLHKKHGKTCMITITKTLDLHQISTDKCRIVGFLNPHRQIKKPRGFSVSFPLYFSFISFILVSLNLQWGSIMAYAYHKIMCSHSCHDAIKSVKSDFTSV